MSWLWWLLGVLAALVAVAFIPIRVTDAMVLWSLYVTLRRNRRN